MGRIQFSLKYALTESQPVPKVSQFDLRYPGVHWFESAPPKAARGNRTLMENQMLVAVRIYRPFKKDLQQPTLSLNNTKFLQEFHLLGTNYLSQLRDLIKCPTDLMTGGDISSKHDSAVLSFQSATNRSVF